MGKTVTIGGDRLGSGKRMQTNLKSYERSTHNLGYLWRSTLSPGTLVPFMVEPALPGDTWDIGLAAEALTLPTLGPLFGSFKLQLDVFQVPVRLYQAQLHNNKLYIGLNMDQIKLPLIQVRATNIDLESEIPIDLQQINPSSLLAYLGIRGVGKAGVGTSVTRRFDACPFLAYWDIYKNYYANKQEEIGYFIHNGKESAEIEGITGSAERTVDEDGTLNAPITLETGQDFIINSANDDFPALGGILEFYIETDWVLIDTLIFGAVHNTNEFYQLTDVLPSWNNKVVSKVRVLKPVSETKVNIVEFPLSNLDDMREDILAAIKSSSAFVVNHLSQTPYGDILEFNDAGKSASYYSQEGLALKTYQSDIFNNWLSTEWIDGQNGINAITSIDTSDHKFSIDTLNLAKKVYSLLNDISMSGGSYEDWIEASWDIESMRKCETPMYEGGLSREIVFNEVVSNSATEQTLDGSIEPLGTLGGRGVMSQKNKGGKCVIKVSEPSYIIGIVSITPRIDYSQGNRWYTNLKTLNDFHKPALDQIGFQDLITDEMAAWDTNLSEDNVPIFYSAGKQPAWINYQTNFNRTYGNFADPRKEMFMTLNRRYEPNKVGQIKDLTTYIDPQKFNYAFASTNLDAMNFWLHIAVDAEVRRKMSAKIMPNP